MKGMFITLYLVDSKCVQIIIIIIILAKMNRMNNYLASDLMISRITREDGKKPYLYAINTMCKLDFTWSI